MGETAVVELQDLVLALTVHGFERGDQEAFRAQRSDPDGHVAYAIRVTAEIVSGDDLTALSEPPVRTVTEDLQNTAQTFPFKESFGDCELTWFSPPVSPGDRVDSCMPALAPEGVTPYGVAYGSDGDYIVWR